MNNQVPPVQTEPYRSCKFQVSGFLNDPESKEYNACRFLVNDKRIICRTAKITPKKVGQFVTFWKRTQNGPIAPFHETDSFDFFVINVQKEDLYGQFVFPKSELLKRGLISSDTKEGKRGFRVYPTWDIAPNKQAQRTQKWQLNYFIKVNGSIDLKSFRDLYSL